VVIGQLGAILVIAEDISSIISEHETFRAIVHSAPTLLDSACVQIFNSTRYVFANNVRSILSQHVSMRSNPIITEGCRMTTRIPIGVNTFPAHAILFECVSTQEKASGASECEAVIVFGTALIQVCVCTYDVITKDVLGIDPVSIA